MASDNPSKRTKLTMTSRRNPTETEYNFHGQVLASVPSTKYLGVTLIEDLKWDTHIHNIFGKANHSIGFTRRNLNIGAMSIKQQAYYKLSNHWLSMPVEYGILTHKPTYKS